MADVDRVSPGRGAGSSAGLRTGRPRDWRYAFLIAGLLLAAASLWFGFTRDLRPDPLSRVTPLQLDWWIYPLEVNAHKRVPVIQGDLNALAVSPDGRKVWAVGRGGLIIHSDDAGATWRRQKIHLLLQQERPPPRAAVAGSTRLAAGPHRRDSGRQRLLHAVILGEDAPGDSGATEPRPLEEQPEQQVLPTEPGPNPLLPRLTAIAMLEDGWRGWAVGTRGAVLHTEDGGATWMYQQTGADEHWTAVGFLPDGRTGWLAGRSGQWMRTEDGGVTWQPFNLSDKEPNPAADGVDISRSGRAILVGGDLSRGRGGRAETFDLVERVRDAGFGLGVRFPLAARWGGDSDQAWIVGNGFAGPLRATSSDRVSDIPVGDLFDIAVSADDLRAWAVGDQGAFVRTEDGGKTWLVEQIRFQAPAFDPDVARMRLMRATDRLVNTQAALSTALDEMQAQALAEPDAAEIPRLAALAESSRALGREIRVREGIQALAKLRLDEAEGTAEAYVGTRGRELLLAQLSAVRFDAAGTRGWIVGADGTLLRSGDGGSTWAKQGYSVPEYLEALEARGDRPEWRVANGQVQVRTESDPPFGENGRGPQHFPPPITVLGFAAAVALALGAAKPPPVRQDVESPISGELATDKPVRFPAEDRLGFQSIAAGLSAFLRNEATEPPLTIAITGPWGSGKSSLMNLLEEDLRRHRFRPVWFNAWHHQTEEDLLAALLEVVRSNAVPSATTAAGWIARWHLMAIRLRRQKLLFAVLLALFVPPMAMMGTVAATQGIDGLMTLLPSGSEAPAAGQEVAGAPAAEGGLWAGLVASSPWLSLAASLIGFFVTARNRLNALGLGSTSVVSVLTGAGRNRRLRAHIGFRQRFAEEFRDVTNALKPITPVIFIDDLDRCQPEKVVQILEAVNFLTSSGDCYVVLGFDYTWVERCVHEVYKDAAEAPAPNRLRLVHPMPANVPPANDPAEFAPRFLEKLINIQVPVPPVRSAEVARLVAAQQAAEAEPSWKDRLRARGGDIARRSAPLLAWFGFAAGLVLLGWLGGQSVLERLLPPEQQVAQGPDVAELSADAAGGPARAAEAVLEEAEQIGELMAEASPMARGTVIALTAAILGVTLVVFFVIREQWRRRHSAVVHDSSDFREALAFWTPFVYDKDRTPRAVKRYVNRVRYFAMRQKFGLQTQAVSESTLVAIAALHHWTPRWFEDDTVKRLAKVGDLRSLVGDVPSLRARNDNEPLWPERPGDDQIALFKDWSAGITVRA